MKTMYGDYLLKSYGSDFKDNGDYEDGWGDFFG